MFGINRLNSNLEFGYFHDGVEPNTSAAGQNRSIFSDNKAFGPQENSLQDINAIFEKEEDKKDFFSSLEDIIELYANEETSSANQEEAVFGFYNKSNFFSFFNEKAKTDSIKDEDITSVLKYFNMDV